MKPLHQSPRPLLLRRLPLILIAMLTSAVVVGLGMGYRLPTSGLIASSLASPGVSTATVWEATATDVIVRDQHGPNTEGDSYVTKKWWQDPRGECFHEARSMPPRSGLPVNYTRWGPFKVGHPESPHWVPEYLMTRLPADPFQAVSVLKVQEDRMSAGSLPLSDDSQEWLSMLRTLIMEFEKGPVWEDDAQQRLWDLIKAVPGIKQEANSDDGRGGKGERWVFRAQLEWMAFVKAHNSPALAVVHSRFNGMKPNRWHERTTTYSVPRRGGPIPDEVRRLAKPGHW